MMRRLGMPVLACALLLPAAGHAMESHIGDAFPVALDFCPADSVPADGQTLPFHGNEAIYSLRQYHRSTSGHTFTLPNLNSGAAAMSFGHGPKMLWCIVIKGFYPIRRPD